MKNEDSDEDKDVGCPYCGEAGRCGHLLLYYDVTFHGKQGGVVDPYQFETIIEAAFTAARTAGRSQKWLAEWVNEFFGHFDYGAVKPFLANSEADLPVQLPVGFLFSLLTEADELEIDGRL